LHYFDLAFRLSFPRRLGWRLVAGENGGMMWLSFAGVALFLGAFEPVVQFDVGALPGVATDILGKSGRAMLDALVAGTTDPDVLAELARGKLRKKIPALREALEGRFEALHALLIGAILAHLDFLDEQIESLSEAIEAELGPTGLAGVALASTITGVATRTAEVMVAEIGTDMSVFPSAGHLASWGGLEFPRFDGHLATEPFGRSGRMSVHGEDPAVFQGVQARGRRVDAIEWPVGAAAGEGAGRRRGLAAGLGGPARGRRGQG